MTKQDILKLFKSIDESDTKTFLTFLDDNANFKFANMPVVSGKKNIGEFLDGFFKSIRSLSHKNLEIYELEGIRFVNGNVTYTRHDGSTLSVDYSNTFKMKGDKIFDYLIFVDNSELYK
ncbi:MAG: nuclear transport factor 2 family protein [Bacteroidales bacterium]|nr:nuclear transport factor 2 family protein [Bacteroidales bacterium]MCB9013409.1 nuclear transport factor 2 family protein [Bacteroidales bacterium]